MGINSAEPFLSSYINQKAVSLGLPVSGTFELTGRCNFSCKMCYVHSDNNQTCKENELSADEWLSIASDARDRGMIFLLLTGGEPFLRKDFSYIYSEIVKMGVIVSVNTNGSVFSDEIREVFKRYPPSRLNVSIYGASSETYMSLCEYPSNDDVIATLIKMKEDGLQVRLNYTVSSLNRDDMIGIHKLSERLGLPVKIGAYLYPPVRIKESIGENGFRLDAAEAGEAVADWNLVHYGKELVCEKAEKLKNNLSDNQSICEDGYNGVTCRAGRSSFWITWDGKMLPCGTMNVEPVGVKEHGFECAWELTKKFVSEIRLPKECISCPLHRSCGVCASICRAETGVFDRKPRYMCEMTDAMYNRIIEIAGGAND